MPVELDPEQAETHIIHHLIDFAGKDVLDIGCGDGRMTWRFAEPTRSVLGLDPEVESIATARARIPDQLRAKVTFQVADITAACLPPAAYDVVVLSWSLCWIAPAGVVHALETIHASLRPHGVLLDVRPAQRHPWVVVHRPDAEDLSERVVRLGQIDDSYRIGTLAIADAALRTLIDAGRFLQEQEETFTFAYHFESVEAWRAYMAEHWSSAHVSAEVIARAQQALPEKAGELCVLREIHAARLRRR